MWESSIESSLIFREIIEPMIQGDSLLGIGEDVRKPSGSMLKYQENAVRLGSILDENQGPMPTHKFCNDQDQLARKSNSLCREGALLGTEVIGKLEPVKLSPGSQFNYGSTEITNPPTLVPLNGAPLAPSCCWFSIPVVSASGELQGVIKLKTTHGVEETLVDNFMHSLALAMRS